ncbi:MAG: heavy metal-binding domain-containing protein [Erysipelotrichaceae bacterium]|nr:heavy metal-binding domain-containing protein [Erysipelotrichaceae bacterium]MDO5085662.1 heavy metal-binding domain-containing protein [Erysipelotrichaceae bacterium]
MIVTTTNTIEHYEIVEYIDVVFGEVVSGVNYLKDVAASFTNLIGGRSDGYEEELITARTLAIKEMKKRASELQADAVVGMKLDCEALGKDGTMLMVTCIGTAVRLQKK